MMRTAYLWNRHTWHEQLARPAGDTEKGRVSKKCHARTHTQVLLCMLTSSYGCASACQQIHLDVSVLCVGVVFTYYPHNSRSFKKEPCYNRNHNTGTRITATYGQQESLKQALQPGNHPILLGRKPVPAEPQKSRARAEQRPNICISVRFTCIHICVHTCKYTYTYTYIYT